MHIPVMRREVIKFLAPHSNENFIDATLGMAGHAKLILENTGPQGKLLGIDQDISAIEESSRQLKNFSGRIALVQANFSELGLIVRRWPVKKINGILFDLGISSAQLESLRGFSFLKSGPLDMRMSGDSQLSAKKIINTWPEQKIREILFRYGEEPMASRIANAITEARRRNEIENTQELVEIIGNAIPTVEKKRRKIHFATQCFQALRIAVNHELENLENTLKQAAGILSPGGRIVIISFHSLEDRIVKHFFLKNASLEILTPKPVVASKEENQENPRSRSAKLRAARKINL